MYLHSCQSTKRNKGYPWHIFRKSVCSAVFKGDGPWGLPPVKAETEIFRLFSFSNFQILGLLFLMCGVLVIPHTPAFSLLSICFPEHFCSFLGLHFLQPHSPVFIFLSQGFPPIFQNTLVYLGFFTFYNHRVLPSLSLPTLGTLPG